MPRPTRVALALGAGGARGYAHIGVIQVLEERGYDIVNVAGTSMGALVGGLHAAGQLEAYTDWATKLTQRAVLRLLDPSIKAPGAIRAEKIIGQVSDLLDGARIEDLPIPFTAITTDLLAGKEVWFQQGPLDAAIRASIALPSVVTPVVINGRLLADGGLLNPVPVAATAAANADLTIAVALSEEAFGAGGASPVQETADPNANGDRGRAAAALDSELVRTVTGWFSGGKGSSPIDDGEEVLSRLEDEADRGPFGALPPGLRTLDVMQLSLEALQSAVMRFRLAGYPPDLLITVPKTACRTLDFHRANEMIELGRARTVEALDRAGPPLAPGSAA